MSDMDLFQYRNENRLRPVEIAVRAGRHDMARFLIWYQQYQKMELASVCRAFHAAITNKRGPSMMNTLVGSDLEKLPWDVILKIIRDYLATPDGLSLEAVRATAIRPKPSLAERMGTYAGVDPRTHPHLYNNMADFDLDA